MTCDICGGDMSIGIAINSAQLDNVRYAWTPSSTAETIAFIDCYKCKECGRSVIEEELKDE